MPDQSEHTTASPRLVRDLMTVGVPTCPPETPVVALTRLMLEKDFEGVMVLDHEGHGVGVVHRDDLITAYAHPGGYQNLTAEDIMTPEVVEFPPDIPLTAAAQMMQDRGVRIVFFRHNAGGIIYPAAMLTYTHILRHLAAQNEQELSDLGIAAERRSPIELFLEKRAEARRNAGVPYTDEE